MSKQFEGFKLPNTTPVPDVLFDELLGELTGNELKVLLYIIRRTYGFGKNADAISLGQFRKGIKTKDEKVLDKGCGIEHNRTILVALRALETKGYILSKKRQTSLGDDDTTIYKLHFQDSPEANAEHGVVTSGNDGSLRGVTTVVTSGNDGSYPTSRRVVTPRNPQETVLQETVLQETVYISADAETPANASLDEEDISDLPTETRLPVVKPDQPTELSKQIPPKELSTYPQGEDHDTDHHRSSSPANIDRHMERNQPTQTPQQHNGTQPSPATDVPAAKTVTAKRKPAKPKENAPTPEQIEAVFSCLDSMACKVTGDENYRYARTKAATEEIKKFLPERHVTRESLQAVYQKMWDTPRDEKTGFDWKEHMSIKAVLNNYDRFWLSIKGKNGNGHGNHTAPTLLRLPQLMPSREQLLKEVY